LPSLNPPTPTNLSMIKSVKWTVRVICLLSIFIFSAAQIFAQPPPEDPNGLSLDSLLSIPVTTASKYKQTSTEAPASMTIISKEDILSFGYNDIGELLNTVRDLYITFDRNYTYLGIRGFSRPTDYNKRIAVLINGVLVNENIWGSGPIGSEALGINLDNIERVEIVRGPGSALYGNYPMLGMINIITKTGKTMNGVSVSVEAGSYGKFQGSVAGGKLFKSGLDLSFSGRAGQIGGQDLYYAEFDDSLNNFGIAQKMDWMKYAGYSMRASLKGFVFDGFYIVKNGGNPTGAYGTLFNDNRYQTSDQFAFTNLEYSRDLNHKMNFFSRAWVNGYKYRGNYPYDSADGGMYLDAANNFWTGVESRFRWDIVSSNRIMAGGEFQKHFQSKYATGYVEGYQYERTFAFQTFAFYIQDEFQPIKSLTITAGARFDYLYLGKKALTPRIAINFRPGKNTTLKALYGNAFRAPNPYEVNLQDTTYILGNLNLRKEGIRTMELILEQRISSSMQGVISFYRNEMKDLIEQVLDTVTYYYQYQNVQQAGGLGVSAEVNGRLNKGSGINFYLNYSFSYMEDLVHDKWLTNSPLHLAKGGISIPFLKHFRISPECIAETGRLNANEVEVNGFVIANANLIFAPKFSGRATAFNRFQLSFKVRNLLNESYGHASGYIHAQPSIQQNGRNYLLKLRVNLF
jgi:outer membrane receptor for ferrienterochelin and colicin